MDNLNALAGQIRRESFEHLQLSSGLEAACLPRWHSLSHKPIVVRIWLWLLIWLFGALLEQIDQERALQQARTRETILRRFPIQILKVFVLNFSRF